MTEEIPGGDVVQAIQNLAKSEMLLVVEQMLDDLDLSSGERNAFMRRLGKRAKIPKVPEKITTSWLIEQVEQKSALALSYLDEFTLMRSNARDLAGVINVLLEKRQLLKGEPTAIIDNNERRAMHEVLPYLMKVMKDRGITVDLGPDHYTVADKMEAVGFEKDKPKPGKFDEKKLPPLLKKRPKS